MFDCCDGVVAFGKARQEGGIGFVALVDVVDFFVLVGFADDWGVAVGGGDRFDDFFQAGFVPAFFFCFGKAVGCVGGLGGDVQGVGCAAPAYFGYFIAAFIDNACFDVAQRDGYLGRLRGQGERAVVVGQADGQLVRLEAAFVGQADGDDAGESVGIERLAVDGQLGDRCQMVAARVGYGVKDFNGLVFDGGQDGHGVLLFGLDACDTAGDGHAELQGFAF